MNSSENASKKLSSRIALWVPTIYYAQGLPFSIIRQVSTYFFRDNGASLISVGFTSLYGIPWTFKFVWSPFVDKYFTKKIWILAMEAILIGIMVLASVLAASSLNLQIVAALFMFGAIVAATHDIAIDGLYLDTLEKSKQAKYSGVQQLGYRLAMWTGMSVLIGLAGKTNWSTSFLVAAGIFGVLFLWHLKILPNTKVVTEKTQEKIKFYEAFTSYLKLPNIKVAIAFILLFRLGELLMFDMSGPFLLDSGMTKPEIALYAGTFGFIAAITSTLTGGLLISKYGLGRMMWVLGFTQNLAIPIYAAAAYFKAPIPVLGLCIVIEQIAGGLGASVYSNFIMRQNDPKFKATHFAVGTGLMSLTFTLAGPLAGLGAHHLGYGHFFMVAFLASIPGMLLIPIVARRPECQLNR